MISNDLYVFLNSFGEPSPLCKYDLLKEKNHFIYCIIYCIWLSLLYLHFKKTILVLLASLTLIILYVKKFKFQN
jgi:hypothetical protein